MSLKRWHLKSVVPVAIFAAAAWWTEHLALTFLGLMALAGAVIVVKKGQQQRAFWWTAVVLPWSTKVNLGAVEVMLPGEWMIGVLALVVVADVLMEGNWAQFRKQLLPALWILSFVVPVAWSSMPVVSLKFALINALFVVVFYYGTLRFGRKEAGRWLKSYFVSMLPVVLWGAYNFYQYDFNPITITGIFKPFYYSSTYVGAAAAMFSGYFIGQVRVHRLNLVLALVAIGVVIFTESRAALISVVVMLLAWGLLALPKRARLVLPVLAAMALVFFGGDRIREAFAYSDVESHDPNANVFEEALSVTNVQTDVSNIERLNRWVSALKMFEDRPHRGYGPGTYQFQYIPFQEAGLKNRLSVRNPDDIPQGSGGSAHSELLLQLSENGWPTVLIFLVMLVVWVRKGLWAGRAELVRNAPYFLALVTYLFHMNVNNFLNQPGFAFLFWTFGALLMMPRNE